MFWGQTGAAECASFTPFHGAVLTGGMNRSLFVGGDAKGTPAKKKSLG